MHRLRCYLVDVIKSQEELKRKLVEFVGSGKPAIICLGSEFGGDDSVGLYIYEKLVAEGFENVVSCEDDLITCVYEVVSGGRPSTLIIIDAVDLGLTPGIIVTSYLEEVEESTTQISTHRLSLTAVVELLKEVAKYRFETVVIGIQIGRVGPDRGISDEVLRAADIVVHGLNELREILRRGSISNPHT